HPATTAAAPAGPTAALSSRCGAPTVAAAAGPPRPAHSDGAAYGNHAPPPSSTTTCVSATTPSSAPTVASRLRVSVATPANGRLSPTPSSPQTTARPASRHRPDPPPAVATADRATVSRTVSTTHAASQSAATTHRASA